MELLSVNIFDALGLDWKSMLIYIANFLVLVLVLVFVLYKPVKKMLKKKRESLDETFAENERLKTESDRLKAEYEEKTEQMKTENARVAAEVAKAAQERSDAVIAEAHEQAKAIVDAAKKDSLYQKEQLKNEYRDSVNTLAVQIAQKLLEREITEKDNAALIEQVLSDWESE